MKTDVEGTERLVKIILHISKGNDCFGHRFHFGKDVDNFSLSNYISCITQKIRQINIAWSTQKYFYPLEGFRK